MGVEKACLSEADTAPRALIVGIGLVFFDLFALSFPGLTNNHIALSRGGHWLDVSERLLGLLFVMILLHEVSREESCSFDIVLVEMGTLPSVHVER